MHPVIEFYLEQRKSQHNLSLQDMWAMPQRMIGDAYFYIPWLLPVTATGNKIRSRKRRNSRRNHRDLDKST